MKNDLDLHMLLRVFEKVREHGKEADEGHQLEGVKASSDFDGYTVFLSDVQCNLTLFFHNKYECDYPTEKAREDFEKRLNYIDKNY